MNKKEITFRDPVVESVVDKFVSRSDVGFAKYGKTLRDDDSDLFTWVNHLQEELMDAVLYMQRLKEEITTLKEEAILARIRDIDVEDSEVWTNANGFSYIIDEES
jgi:succinate dehydrogenase flavin-adding protein (antitoxin of CptAB toxin-antitoxin module)